MLRKILALPVTFILFVVMILFDIARFTILSPLLAFILPAVLLAICGSIIGLISGYFAGVQLIAAIVVGIIFFITWPLSQKRQEIEIRALSYTQAFWGGIAGGISCYFIGSLVD
ncbi:MAG: hypothetical protein HQ577_03090 [Dehalococcoidia bacterium]|nr:hypothetical protein [Dehalococcoidia bacterium]